MAHLIDKDTLIGEIRWRIFDTELMQRAGRTKKRDADKRILLFESILSFIDTIEVKEVDLEKEIDEKYREDTSTLKIREKYAELAKYFFELGIKTAQKGE